MAEEKLGTLQYDMLVDQTKLEDSLKKIDALLIATDAKWRDSLSNMGSGSVKGIIETQNALIELARSGDSTVAAGKKVITSNIDIETSYEKLKVEIKEAIAAQEKLTVAQKSAPENQAALASLQKKIDLYAQFKESLNEATKSRKQEDSDAKRKAINDEKEVKRLKELTAAQDLYRSKLMITAKNLPAGSVERSSAYTKVLQYDLKNAEDPAQVQRLNQAINAQDAIRKRLITTQKEQKRAAEDLFLIQKLQAAVDAQSAGSIGQLRAQYALLRTQLSQVKFSDPNAVASVQRLQTAIAGVKAEIQALQPTLGIWGKLTSAIRTYATAYLSVQAVLGLGRAVYGQTKGLDSLDFSMKTVIKSSTELAQTQKFLSEVAVNYGSDLLTLSERYIKFRAAAVQSNVSAAQTQKIFESVSKAAGTLGLRTDELSGTYLALEQMLSKGKVTTEELRRQLGERLPGAFGIMANALGVTIPELDKMLKNGEVLSTVALPKFAAALEKAYGIESLKKIDTLAAAQGRLSTEFTGLIKGIGASDTFKAVINGMASFIGLVKDNIGTIGLLTKAMFSVVAVTSIYRLRILAAGVAQFAMIALTNNQNIATNRLSGSMLSAAVSINTATRSWKAFGAALASNWVGLLLTGISVLVTSLISFKKNSEEATSAVVELGKEYSKSINNVNLYLRSIEKASKTSGEYKEALRGLNDISIKYNSTLLTEKSGLDEINSKRKDLIALITEEYLKKKQIIDLESSTAQRDAALDPIRKEFYEAFKYVENGAIKASLAYEKFLDAATDTRNRTSFAKQLADDTGINFGRMYGYLRDAAKALNKFRRDQEVQTQYYSQPLKGIEFKSEDIEAAKKEFEEYEKLKKRSEQGLLDPTFVTEQSKTYREWIENQIYLFKKLGDNTAVKELTIALVDLDKAEGKSADKAKSLAADRAEAIKKLNDKYLADQEDFANYEMGIQATRIANMEDGLDKEIKLNELAYEKRIAAIEKEKIATIKLLNEAAGIRVGSAQEIKTLDATGYGKEVQDQASKAREADLQKRKNAENDLRESNLKSEKDYQIKINEIRRDANDQFLSGIQKEKAAINEKYDEWVRKATTNKKLVDEIESSRRVAISEVDRQNAIDRLDFEREIEYKKNEIKLNGNKQAEKLEEENFNVYYKYELKRAKLLLQSVNVDKQQEGKDVLNKLLLDTELQGLLKKTKYESTILSIAKEQTAELVTQLGLSESQSKVVSTILDGFIDILSGDPYSAVAKGASLLVSIQGMQTKKWEEQKKALQDIIDLQQEYNLLLNDQIRIGGTDSIFFDDASEQILNASKALTDAQEKLSKLLRFKIPTPPELPQNYFEFASVAEAIEGTFVKTGIEWNKLHTESWNTYDKILNVYPELIDENGQLNTSLLETVLNNDAIWTSQNAWLRDGLAGLSEWAKKAEEAQQAMNDAVASMIGNLGSSIYTAIADAWDNGTDSFMAFKGAVSDGLEDIIKQMAFNAIWAASLETFKEGIIDSYKLGGDQDIFDNIDEFFAAAPENIKLTNEALEALDRRAAESGMDWRGTTDTSAGISKGIQALTEDTGRRLEGLINSIRETSVMNMGNTKQLVESSQMIQGYAAQSLGHLRNIDMTTSEQLKLLNSVVFSGHSKGGAGIKTFTD